MLSAILLIPLLILALRWANWSRMREQRLINVFLFSVLVVLLFWSLRIPVMEGVSWHVSGITFLTLMWGWSFALLGGSLAVIVQTLALQRIDNECAQYDFSAACGVANHLNANGVGFNACLSSKALFYLYLCECFFLWCVGCLGSGLGRRLKFVFIGYGQLEGAV